MPRQQISIQTEDLLPANEDMARSVLDELVKRLDPSDEDLRLLIIATSQAFTAGVKAGIVEIAAQLDEVYNIAITPAFELSELDWDDPDFLPDLLP